MTKFLALAGILALMTVLLPFQNCSSVHDVNETITLESMNVETYQREAMKVLSLKCASCHNPTATANTGPNDILNLDQLILNGEVVPGKPERSPLYLDVVDGIMPKGGARLSSQEMVTLSDWIWVLGNPSGMPGISGTAPGTGTGTGPGTGAPPTFTRVMNEVLRAQCNGCHSTASNAGGRALDTYAGVMGVVQPGAPGQSSLYTEVNTGSMPKNAAPLSLTQKLLIFNWIAAGARND